MFNNRIAILACLLVLSIACQTPAPPSHTAPSFFTHIQQNFHSYYQQILLAAIPPATGFDFPVGPPNAKGYYNAQAFYENGHLGDDWNGTGGGNSDFGDPIYSIADGYVIFAQDIQAGWGKIVRIVHHLPDSLYKSPYSEFPLVESLYAHLEEITVPLHSFVKKGQQIGTMGNADGIYYAHLHFEIRTLIGLDIGGGYSDDTTFFTDPTRFINQHREMHEKKVE